MCEISCIYLYRANFSSETLSSLCSFRRRMIACLLSTKSVKTLVFVQPTRFVLVVKEATLIRHYKLTNEDLDDVRLSQLGPFLRVGQEGTNVRLDLRKHVLRVHLVHAVHVSAFSDCRGFLFVHIGQTLHRAV